MENDQINPNEINNHLNPIDSNLQDNQINNNINPNNTNNTENITNRDLLNSANNSLEILNRISSELNTLQERLNNQSNQINNINRIDQNNLINLNNFARNENVTNNRGEANLNFINKILSDFPFQNKFFLFSSGLAGLILCWLIVLNIHHQITFSYLESEDMYLNYLLLNILIFLFTWNYYLVFSNFILETNLDLKNVNKISIKLKEILLFSPFWMYCVIKYSVPNYLSTIFDGFFIIFISIQYTVNFIFSIRLYKYSNNKIMNISNIHLDENKKIMRNIRLNYFVIAIYNIIFMTLVILFLSESDLFFKFIILNKVIIYFFKFREFSCF